MVGQAEKSEALAASHPITLVVVASSLNGAAVFVYSMLRIQVDRNALPETVKVKSYRLGALVVSGPFFLGLG